ncbi:MAG: hypothetical protein JNM18_13895 [Planctomycetaceae bacterium]|nr:hypothetical protein [Planctomycetaceae bacterium]
MTKYFVTHPDRQAFHGRYTRKEIKGLHAKRSLPATFLVTEADSRSFDAFTQRNNARWRTVSEFLDEQPAVTEPVEQKQVQLSSHIGFNATLPRLILVTAALLNIFFSFVSPLLFLTFAPKTELIVILLMIGVAICFHVAFALLCARAIALERIVVDQDAENRRLWLAIDELRSATGSSADTSGQK